MYACFFPALWLNHGAFVMNANPQPAPSNPHPRLGCCAGFRPWSLYRATAGVYVKAFAPQEWSFTCTPVLYTYIWVAGEREPPRPFSFLLLYVLMHHQQSSRRGPKLPPPSPLFTKPNNTQAPFCMLQYFGMKGDPSTLRSFGGWQKHYAACFLHECIFMVGVRDGRGRNGSSGACLASPHFHTLARSCAGWGATRLQSTGYMTGRGCVRGEKRTEAGAPSRDRESSNQRHMFMSFLQCAPTQARTHQRTH